MSTRWYAGGIKQRMEESCMVCSGPARGAGVRRDTMRYAGVLTGTRSGGGLLVAELLLRPNGRDGGLGAQPCVSHTRHGILVVSFLYPFFYVQPARGIGAYRCVPWKDVHGCESCTPECLHLRRVEAGLKDWCECACSVCVCVRACARAHARVRVW